MIPGAKFLGSPWPETIREVLIKVKQFFYFLFDEQWRKTQDRVGKRTAGRQKPGKKILFSKLPVGTTSGEERIGWVQSPNPYQDENHGQFSPHHNSSAVAPEFQIWNIPRRYPSGQNALNRCDSASTYSIFSSESIPSPPSIPRSGSESLFPTQSRALSSVPFS